VPQNEVRLYNSAVQLHNYRIDHMRKDRVYEISVDFHASDATSSMLIWTSIAGRMRVKIGAGAYVAVGATRATAVDLGAFTDDETKAGTIEIKIPPGENTRHEELSLNIGYGV